MSEFTVLSRLMIGIPGTTVPPYFHELVERGLRSVVIYGENVESETQLKEFVGEIRNVLGPDSIIAIDEEGGDVTRVDYKQGSRFVGNSMLGQIDDVGLTQRDGKLLGQLLAYIGVNLNFAPVADVNINPANPVIGNRSFGSSKETVARHVAAFVRGHESAGVGTCLKHFPGHGDVTADSHKSLPVVRGGRPELEAHHLEPFRVGIQEGAAAVMIGHLDLGDGVPTSLSQEIVDWLRHELDFSGLVVTDAIDMGAVVNDSSLASATVRALLAGNDLVCMGPSTKLEDLAEVERLWAEIDSKNLAESEAKSQERISNFVSKYSREPAESAVNPQYDLNLVPAGKLDQHRVIRLESETNLAVGQVPWLPGIAVEETIATHELAMLASKPSKLAIITRGGSEVWAALERLEADSLARITLIATQPPPPSLGVKSFVTYGSASPQASAVQAAISRKEN